MKNEKRRPVRQKRRGPGSDVTPTRALSRRDLRSRRPAPTTSCARLRRLWRTGRPACWFSAAHSSVPFFMLPSSEPIQPGGPRRWAAIPTTPSAAAPGARDAAGYPGLPIPPLPSDYIGGRGPRLSALPCDLPKASAADQACPAGYFVRPASPPSRVSSAYLRLPRRCHPGPIP